MTHQGTLYAIGSGLLYGLTGYFGMSIISEELSISCMLFWRFLVATLLMGLLVLLQRENRALMSKESIKAFLYGLLFYGSSTTLYFMTSLYMGTGIAMVIFFTFPAMVMLINLLIFKAPFHKTYLAAFGVTLCGMICLIDTSSLQADLWAIALGLFCALLYGCYIVGSKKVTLPSKTSTLMVSAGCMITSLIILFFEESLTLPQTSKCWINIISMGIIGTALPILLLLQALKYISSEKASLLSVLEPVFVVIFGILLLGEEISTKEIIGIAIILSGTILTLRGEKAASAAATD